MVSSKMIQRMRILFLVLIASLCSCGRIGSQGTVRVGIDPLWSPIDFGPQTSYVNGYTEDLLLEMAQYSGMQFQLLRANGGDLLEGLRSGIYDVVLTATPPYEYHLAKYDFSENFLDLGPVLIVSYGSKKNSLSQMDGDMVGIIANDPAELILAKYPALIIRSYNSIPDLLGAVARGEIEAALLDQIPAVNFVTDLYAGVLQIASPPMTQEGIHLVGPKGGMDGMNRTLTSLRKKKTVDSLLKKWGLAS